MLTPGATKSSDFPVLLQLTNSSVFLTAPTAIALLAHAGGVDENVAFVAARDEHVVWFACRVSHVGGNEPLFPDDRIEEG